MQGSKLAVIVASLSATRLVPTSSMWVALQTAYETALVFSAPVTLQQPSESRRRAPDLFIDESQDIWGIGKLDQSTVLASSFFLTVPCLPATSSKG